jgi:hypothetical protein
MKPGFLKQSVSSAKNLAKKLDVSFKSCSLDGELSNEVREVIYKNDVELLYRTITSLCAYDLMLKDGSLLQFCWDSHKLRYTYIQFPFDCEPLAAFEESWRAETSSLGTLVEDYGQLLTEAQLNKSALIIRYEYCQEQYVEGVHPVSHMHVGIGNSSRFPFRHKLSPEAFAAFIFRQFYHEEWIGNCDRIQGKIKGIKSRSIKIADEYFSRIDEQDFYLL